VRDFGRYRIVDPIGSGGMGAIYRARLVGPMGFEKWVAIKVIHPQSARDSGAARMFLDEMRVASRLQHTNVCSVLDFGVEAGELYLVMEYLDGVSLARVVDEAGRLPPELASRIVADAARGLHAAHELRDASGERLGVVHRDVSPQNIVIVRDGTVKVLDFGVAAARGRLSDTRSDQVKGKLAYMAPEHASKQPVDRRADVWALGVVLWEASVGERLFAADNDVQTLTRLVHEPIPRPSARVPSYPAMLETIVMRALERDPVERTPTAAALADELEKFLYGTGEPFGAVQVAGWLAEHVTIPAPVAADAPLAPRAPDRRWLESTSDAPAVEGTQTREERDATTAARTTRSSRRVRARLAAALLTLAVLGAALAAVAVVSRPPERRHTDPAAPAAPRSASPPPAAAAPARPVPSPPPDPAPPSSTSTSISARPEPHPRRARATGLLNLLAVPQAIVIERGHELGRTPVIEAQLPAGTHVLVLRPVEGDGPPVRVTVRIEPGRVTRRTVRLDDTR